MVQISGASEQKSVAAVSSTNEIDGDLFRNVKTTKRKDKIAAFTARLAKIKVSGSPETRN